MKFLDEVKIYISSGNGGPGCISFRREANVPKGGPDGGNGGDGGNVIIKTVDNLNTLIDYRYKQHFKAKSGQHGMGKNRNGHNADDIILKVPFGTEILNEDKNVKLADLVDYSNVFQELRYLFSLSSLLTACFLDMYLLIKTVSFVD